MGSDFCPRNDLKLYTFLGHSWGGRPPQSCPRDDLQPDKQPGSQTASARHGRTRVQQSWAVHISDLPFALDFEFGIVFIYSFSFFFLFSFFFFPFFLFFSLFLNLPWFNSIYLNFPWFNSIIHVFSSDRSSLRDDALNRYKIDRYKSFSDAPRHYITTSLLSINATK